MLLPRFSGVLVTTFQLRVTCAAPLPTLVRAATVIAPSVLTHLPVPATVCADAHDLNDRHQASVSGGEGDWNFSTNMAIRWFVVLAPSTVFALATCVSTVLGLMKHTVAASWHVYPAAKRESTSISRGVRCVRLPDRTPGSRLPILRSCLSRNLAPILGIFHAVWLGPLVQWPNQAVTRRRLVVRFPEKHHTLGHPLAIVPTSSVMIV